MATLTLTTPVPAPVPGRNSFTLSRLVLDVDLAQIEIVGKGDDGKKVRHTIKGAAATTLMGQLNNADLSTNTLKRRVLQRLVDDGVLVGTVS